MVLFKMEEYAYKYGIEMKNYDIPLYPDAVGSKRVHMSQLFDMVSGTSTGSMLAAGLVIPEDDDWMEENKQTVPKYGAT